MHSFRNVDSYKSLYKFNKCTSYIHVFKLDSYTYAFYLCKHLNLQFKIKSATLALCGGASGSNHGILKTINFIFLVDISKIFITERNRIPTNRLNWLTYILLTLDLKIKWTCNQQLILQVNQKFYIKFYFQ